MFLLAFAAQMNKIPQTVLVSDINSLLVLEGLFALLTLLTKTNKVIILTRKFMVS